VGDIKCHNKVSLTLGEENIFIQNNIAEYLNSIPEIKFAYLFGSFGTPQYVKGRSDIDIAVYGDRVFNFQEMMEITDGLQNKVSGFSEIDLIDLRQDAIILHNEIVQNGKLLFVRDQTALDRFHMTQWSMYIDHKEYMKRFEEDFKKRVLK